MSTPILAILPPTIAQGCSVQWTAYADGYPAPTWAATATLFSSKSTLTLTGTTYGAGWAFSLTASQSAELFPGLYGWQIFATSGSDRVLIASGTTDVIADAGAQQIPKLDPRSTSRKLYEDLSELMGNAAYMKSLLPEQVAALEVVRKNVEWDVKRERDAEKLRQGINVSRKIYTRFI